MLANEVQKCEVVVLATLKRTLEGDRLAVLHQSVAGSKETGQSVTHYIIAGGGSATAYAKLKARFIYHTLWPEG